MVPKGLYQNYAINHGGGVVIVKMFNRNEKEGIAQDDIDNDLYLGGSKFLEIVMTQF